MPLRPKISFTASKTCGMRVMPPTRITSSIRRALSPASRQRAAARIDRLLDQIVDELLKLRARQFNVEMLRSVVWLAVMNGLIHVRLHRGGQLDLGLFGGLLQALQGRACRCAGRFPCSFLNSSAK